MDYEDSRMETYSDTFFVNQPTDRPTNYISTQLTNQPTNQKKTP